MRILFATLVLTLIAYTATAQIQTPASSPSSKLEQKVGLTDVTITYARPSMRGRKIFGSLLPYDRMWRTGANASTKFTVNQNVKIEGNELKKGTYALYTIPGESEWTIIFHKNLKHWGTGGKNYKQEEDAFRFTVKPKKLNDAVETLTIGIGNLKHDGATVYIAWENTKVAFSMSVNTDATVASSIKKTLAGPDMRDYYQAAAYYLASGKDLNQALEWINLAMDKGGDAKFWMVRRKALIEAGLGQYKAAIKSAKLSMKLAEKADNDDYIRLNKKSIAEWKKMKSQ